MEYLDSDHHEWNQMWQEVAQHPINNGDKRCLNGSSEWEYLGSSEDHHNFRHHKHPASDNIEYIYLERCGVSNDWSQHA